MKCLLFLLLLVAMPSAGAEDASLQFTVDDDFAGGNIVIDSIANDRVFLHQDLNDFGPGNWFYWNFRVKGAAGRKLTFEFTHPWGEARKRLNVIGVRGPAISLDRGNTWNWMGAGVVEHRSFSYDFGAGQNDVRFSFGMPYVASDFATFIGQYKDNINLDMGSLAITRGGRSVERIHIGNIHGNAKYRIVITARHHASEMMANYVLEGIISFFLENEEQGKWFRENVEALIVPFVDKDGVQEGEQGKGRRGRDHNRDYSGTSIYAATEALRTYVPLWSKGKLVAGIDLHCPWIRGGKHEVIHQAGMDDDSKWKEQKKLSVLLEKATADSTLMYFSANDIPFGSDWNTSSNTAVGDSFRDWIAKIDGVKLATTLEIPYANASGRAVTQASARTFGGDLATALVHYLKNLDQ